MSWIDFSKIADVFSILSFIASVALFLMSHSVFKELNYQKEDYVLAREDIKASLIAARENIFDDKIYDLRMRSDLRAKLFECRQRFFFLLRPSGLWHMQKSICILNKGITRKNADILCRHIDYLIGWLGKRRIINNGKN